jgi:hypothetical protein
MYKHDINLWPGFVLISLLVLAAVIFYAIYTTNDRNYRLESGAITLTQYCDEITHGWRYTQRVPVACLDLRYGK